MSGLKDFNMPAAVSEQVYMALKQQNIPTELILCLNQYREFTVPGYPENH